MHVIMDLIYGKAIGYQKSFWFLKGGQFSSFLSLAFHFGFYNLLQQKKPPFLVQIWMFMTSMLFENTCAMVFVVVFKPFVLPLHINEIQVNRVTNKTRHHLGLQMSIVTLLFTTKKPNKLIINDQETINFDQPLVLEVKFPKLHQGDASCDPNSISN